MVLSMERAGEAGHLATAPWPAETGALVLCGIAAIAASYLSGVNFPEQNNIWHLPIVLDFYQSAEGPHDAYDASFAHFVSMFWLAVRAFTNEGNVRTVFVALQLIGNVGIAMALYGLIRLRVTSVVLAALVTTFCCFCYGLWGATRLGYSEIFVTYATHTQFAIIFCLLCFVLLVRGGVFWAAVLLGLAACTNLFIGAWGGLAAGIFLIWKERRLLSGAQIRFAAVFLLLAAPALVWAVRGGDRAAVVPTAFFHEFLSGHVYGLRYPQALVQTFALLLAASFAVLARERDLESARPLGMLALSATAALALGVIMPYVTERPLLLLLHPLRFNSVTMVLAMACAGTLLATAVSRADASDLLAPFIAAAGFMLKLPLASIFGFALLLRGGTRGARLTGLALALTGTLGLLLPTPITAVPIKSTLAYVLMCAVLLFAVARTVRQGGQTVDGLAIVTVTVLGALTAVPLSAPVIAAVVVCLPPIVLCFVACGHQWRMIGFVAIAFAALLVLYASSEEPSRMALVAAGLALGAVVAPLVVRSWWSSRSWRVFLPDSALVAMVFTLIAVGLAKGTMAGFSITSTASQRDFAEAQRWARSHMAVDAMVLPLDVPDGFSLFARRPVWWEVSQGAAVLWMPSFYSLYACRSRALAEARTPAQRLELAITASIDYLVVTTENTAAMQGPSFVPVYRNVHYVILRNDNARPASPLCRDSLYRRE